MKDQEHQLQVTCIRYFRYKYSDYLIWAIPNGGQRNAIVAVKLKAEGVLSGVPDIFIAAPRGKYHGLFIELKVGKNKLTESQKEIIPQLKMQQYKCEVCYSFDEFKDLVDTYMNISICAKTTIKKFKPDTSKYGAIEPAIIRWLEYKADIKNPYKSQDSIDTMARKLWKLSNGNYDIAMEIVEQSIANNWKGLFELNNSSNGRNNAYNINRSAERQQRLNNLERGAFECLYGYKG